MKRLYSRRYLAPILALALFGAVLPMQGCPGGSSDKVREARKAAFRIQVVTDAGVDTTASLFERKVITPAQTKQIASVLLKINHANRVLIDKAAAMTADTPENRAALFQTVRAISDAVKELKALGVLGIKNPDGSAAFDATMAALDTSLALIEAALAGGN